MSDEIKEARSREESFISNVSGKPVLSSKTGKKKKSKFKKRAPLIAILALLALGVGLIFVSQTMMPFAIVNRFIEEFNTIGVSSTLRSDNILDLQLSAPNSVLGLSSTQREALKSLYVMPADVTVSSTRVTALVFKDSNNAYTAVVPKCILGSASAKEINAAVSTALTTALSDSSYNPTNNPISTETALKLNAFKEKYASASKIWRGGSSGWYDSLTDLTEARLAISRRRYASWATTVFNSGTKEAWKKLASGRVNSSDSGISGYGTYVDTDANGNDSTSTVNGSIDGDSLSSQTTMDGVRKVLNSKIVSVAQMAATVGCAGVEIASAIHTVMSAQQSLQYLNLATGYFEAVQSAQMGFNDGSPMNEYNESLTRRDSESGKSAMESAGMTSLFSGTKISSSDESVKSTNFESLMSSLGTLTSNVRFTAEAFQACSYIKMGVAATNFASTILSFVPVLGQATKAIQIVAKVVRRLALGVAVGAIASFLIPKILAQVTKNIISNVATEWTGADLGNALASGANKYLGGNSQTGGGSPASKQTLTSYIRNRDVVVAENAELERSTRSPFDITSQYTFLGSIVYSLIPLATTTSAGSFVKTLGSLLSGSLTNLLPSASAVAETDLMSSIGDCPLLESVGMVGDAYCNPYYITDEATITSSPDSIEEKVASLSSNNFSGTSASGQKIINPTSNLGKYVKYCGQRNSQYGIADANIANQIVQQPSSLVSNLPLVGDLAQIVTALGEADNIPWISGSACAASDDNPYWAENQYYQRYIEDQRLFESAGIVNKSNVTAMLEDFYEENPLDNTYEGVLARLSGMTREDVVATLDYIDALNYIANYDPSSREIFSDEAKAYSAEKTYAIISPCQVNRFCETPKSLLSTRTETPRLREVLLTLVTPKILS